MDYSRLKKAKLIAFLRESCTRPPSIPIPRPIPAPRPPPRPVPAPRPPPRPISALRSPPALHTRPPPPPLVRPRQQELRPYKLKAKREKETFIEPPMEQKESPPTNPKQLKRMKKKLGELNRKIRHSKKKNDGLIHKRNSLRRVIEELKQGTRQPTIECRQGFVECE